MESSLAEMLLKVGMFILVQALVYLILSNSSNIFSKTIKRTASFRSSRSFSMRRIMATLADLPLEEEPSPSPMGSQSPVLENSKSGKYQ